METVGLIESFQEFKEAENIDRPTMMKVIEDVFNNIGVHHKFFQCMHFTDMDIVMNQLRCLRSQGQP